MIHKSRGTAGKKWRFLWRAAVSAGVAAVLWSPPLITLADSTGTVKVPSAVIRERADKESGPVGSASSGSPVTITEETTDASGTLWYQVSVDGRTGYIRADLVDKQSDGSQSAPEGGDTQGDAGGGAAAVTDAPGASVQAENGMDAQYASVSTEVAMVRAAPSKNEATVDKLARDSQVVVSGQSNGSDGKVWYYVTFTGTDNAQHSGYIRSDLLSLGDMVPAPEEAPPVEPETPAEPVAQEHNDYELAYEAAEGEWYLIDYTAGGEYAYKQKLQPLLDAVDSQSEGSSEDAKTLVKQRIAIVALAVVAAVCVVVIIIMAVKLRDAYYEDYEDDEEEEDDEDEEEEEPSPRRGRREEAQSPSPRRRRGGEEEETTARRRRRTEDEETERPSRRQSAGSEKRGGARENAYRGEEGRKQPASPAKRKAKNFLLDDDDFEFEFLNMDDKG